MLRTEFKNNTEITSITLFDTCQYTTCGLSLLCEKHSEWEINGIARTTSQLIELITDGKSDVLICGLGTQPNDLSEMLNIPNYPFSKVILLIEKNSNTLKNMFTTAGFSSVISKTTPPSELKNVLNEEFRTPKKNTHHKKASYYLPQERYILGALLKGQKPDDIAKTLGISYRTVSRYKQSALRRAGIKNINQILSCQQDSIF